MVHRARSTLRASPIRRATSSSLGPRTSGPGPRPHDIPFPASPSQLRAPLSYGPQSPGPWRRHGRPPGRQSWSASPPSTRPPFPCRSGRPSAAQRPSDTTRSPAAATASPSAFFQGGAWGEHVHIREGLRAGTRAQTHGPGKSWWHKSLRARDRPRCGMAANHRRHLQRCLCARCVRKEWREAPSASLRHAIFG